MDKLLARDEKRFLDALDQAIGPFLKVGDDAKKDVRDLIEPVGEVAGSTTRTSTAEAVAAELGHAEHRGGPARSAPTSSASWASARSSTPRPSSANSGRARGRSLFHSVSNELGRATIQAL